MKVAAILEAGQQSHLDKIVGEVDRLKREYERAEAAKDAARGKTPKKDYGRLRLVARRARRAWIRARRDLKGIRTTKPKTMKVSGQEDWVAERDRLLRLFKRNILALAGMYEKFQRECADASGTGTAASKGDKLDIVDATSWYSWRKVRDAANYAIKTFFSPSATDASANQLRKFSSQFTSKVVVPASVQPHFMEFYKPYFTQVLKRVLELHQQAMYAHAKVLGQTPVETPAKEEVPE